MNENKLPEWAEKGLAEAGVDAAGWAYDADQRLLERLGIRSCLTVNKNGDVNLSDQAETVKDGLKSGLQLADRLARALEGKPDARVDELEVKVKVLEHELGIAFERLAKEIAKRFREPALSQPEMEGGEG